MYVYTLECVCVLISQYLYFIAYWKYNIHIYLRECVVLQMFVSLWTVLVMSLRHLHRLDQELAAIATVNGLPHRHGRQYSSREDALLSTIAKERELFEGAGFGEYVLRTNVYVCVHSCTPVCSTEH